MFNSFESVQKWKVPRDLGIDSSNTAIKIGLILFSLHSYRLSQF